MVLDGDASDVSILYTLCSRSSTAEQQDDGVLSRDICGCCGQSRHW